MRRRLLYALGLFALTILVTLVVWQGSFTFGAYGPASPTQTFLFWAISTLIALLTVIVGFMLFRTAVKLYIERQSNREGSRIRSKLIFGALALSFVPVIFLLFLGYGIMNRNLAKWFSRPAVGIEKELIDTAEAMNSEFRARVAAQARWLAALPQTASALESGDGQRAFFEHKCVEQALSRVAVLSAGGREIELCREPVRKHTTPAFTARVPVHGLAQTSLVVTAFMPADLAARQAEIDRHVREYDQIAANQKEIRNLYMLYMVLIAMFVLFVATWIARILADQISNPISSLLQAAGEVRKGNLSVRLNIKAIDELATLVHAFNEMVKALETNRQELEARRRFTEAILESIPTGVISASADGTIQRTNRALRGIFPEDMVGRAVSVRDLFAPDDAAELRYLFKRARRTGVAGSQLEFKSNGQSMNLAVTVSALDDRVNSGFVVVIEDTSELLRAQKAAAWQEVARRVAHELKNPLTPIGLSAERIARQIERGLSAPGAQKIVHDCSVIIAREVETVKTLVDEFSQFARFPAARPVRCDLNEVVRKAMDVFAGRLDGIAVHMSLQPDLPDVNIDPEQFKRVVINLVDNAAEAMYESLVRNLFIATHSTGETVELIVTDTGCGVSAETKEKLFLPYFSTKRRGTGLGLAIVSRIVAEHNATIRVEENKPAGARFIVEIPAMTAAEPESPALVTAG
ncbi:MAG TPA: ATP-binding protein [Bryobacteraceae bacterium]|nr:ATP-binding protein [Bryobacteraceae bacterium]